MRLFIFIRRGIYIPKLIEEENISLAWKEAVEYILTQSNAECTNLVVHINNPTALAPEINQLYNTFCERNNLTKYIKVAAFLFPQRTFEILGENKDKLYERQRRIHKVVKGRWGSYFDQMVNWRESNGATLNQLDYIINKINERRNVLRAAYTILIPNPIIHRGYTRGGPCLHYITIQLNPRPRRMNLLALYRNHDFAERAYGNYLGLGNLLYFLASKTGFQAGTVTCVSSNAFIKSEHRTGLRNIIKGVPNE